MLVKRQIGKSIVGWKGRAAMPGKLPQGMSAVDQGDPQPLLDEGEGYDRNIDLDIQMQPRAFPRRARSSSMPGKDARR